MRLQQLIFSYEEFDNDSDLPSQDFELLNIARSVTKNAYAPYSNFYVGAAARLLNEKIVTGTNQENASFPAGICAERVLLSAVTSLYLNVAIDTIAITYENKNGTSYHPVSPCGICRQSLLEFEKRFNQPIRIILAGKTGKVFIIKSAAHLLPLNFSSADLA